MVITVHLTKPFLCQFLFGTNYVSLTLVRYVLQTKISRYFSASGQVVKVLVVSILSASGQVVKVLVVSILSASGQVVKVLVVSILSASGQVVKVLVVSILSASGQVVKVLVVRILSASGQVKKHVLQWINENKNNIVSKSREIKIDVSCHMAIATSLDKHS